MNHPNIFTLHSVENDGEMRFITMELVTGRNLTGAIPGEGMPLGLFLDQPGE